MQPFTSTTTSHIQRLPLRRLTPTVGTSGIGGTSRGTTTCPRVRNLAPVESSNIEITVSRSERQMLASAALAEEDQLPELIIDATTITIFDDKVLRAEAVVKVTVPSYSGRASPNDPRLGVVDLNKVCATCHKDNLECPGHLGYIALNTKLIHPLFVSTVIKVLTCVCNSCGGLLLTREEIKHQSIERYTGEERLTLLAKASKDLPCRHQHEVQGIKKCRVNPIYLPTRTKDTKKIMYYYPNVGVKGIKKRTKPTAQDEHEKSVDDIDVLFQVISREDAESMGFLNGSHPRRFVLRSFPVIPPGNRPEVIQDGTRWPDQLTTMYVDIVKRNNAIGAAVTANDENLKQKAISELASFIEHFIDNSDGKFSQGHRKEFASIKQRIQGKKALIRGALMGKRVNYGARTVISPDPSLKFGQARIPRVWAPVLTQPVTINNINRDAMTSLLRMNPPHITTITPSTGRYRGRRMKVTAEFARTHELETGDIVDRWLQNGDRVILNRQPTLHKQSMMAYEVVLGSPLTIGLRLESTTAHNADFDGDEMNAHAVQTIGAQTELREILDVKKCIMNGQTNKPMIGIVYDALTGSFLLTQPGVEVEPNLYNDCVMMITSMDGLPTLDARLRKANIPKYSGRGLFSAVLPPDFYYTKGKVVVINGVLLNGVITKEHIGTTHGSIVQALYKDYGEDRVVDFLTDLPFVINRWLQERGFSVGLKDCYLDNNGVSEATAEERIRVEEQTGFTEVRRLEDEIVRIEREAANSDALRRDLGNTSWERSLRYRIQEAEIARDAFLERVETERFEASKQAMRDRAREQEELREVLMRQINEIIAGRETLAGDLERIFREVEGLPALREQLEEARGRVDQQALREFQARLYSELQDGKKDKQKILREEITKAKLGVEALGTRLADPFEEERRERQVIGLVNIAKTVGERISKENMSQTNALNVMIGSGAKGTLNNWAQITTALFQQFVTGQRMPMTITQGQRCLPYFAPGELDPEARGFCVSSFISGMSPAELFFHQAGGREGLMDTAVKTAETGSIHHRIIKALEDVKVAYDGSVRNAVGTVFQFTYGDDGFDPAELERVSLGGFGDNSVPSFIDLDRVVGRINASFGYTEYTIPSADLVENRDELPEIEAERLDFAEVEYDGGED